MLQRAVGLRRPRYTWASDMADQLMTHNLIRSITALQRAGRDPRLLFSYTDHGFDLIGGRDAPAAPAARPDRGFRPRSEHLVPSSHPRHPPHRPQVLPSHRHRPLGHRRAASRRPAHQLLGGARTRLPAYASTPLLADADAYVAFVGELLERGFRAVKFHAWCEADRDLEMLRGCTRATPGPGIRMMHDAEQRYDRVSALRVARELDAWGSRGWRRRCPTGRRGLRGAAPPRASRSCPQATPSSTCSRSRQAPPAPVGCAHRRHRRRRVYARRKLIALAEGAGCCELQSWGYTLIQAANLHPARPPNCNLRAPGVVPRVRVRHAGRDPPDAEGYVHAWIRCWGSGSGSDCHAARSVTFLEVEEKGHRRRG